MPFPQPVGTPLTVTLHPESAGGFIPESFLGFSYEISALTDPTFLMPGDSPLLNLYANLAPGVIRVGGNSSDELIWTGGPRTATTGNDSLTTTDIDHFAAWAKASGWPVLFGLNLGTYDVPGAVNEAQYVSGALGSSLFAFQIGNEADLFHDNGLRPSTYTYRNFDSEWEAYRQGIRGVLPTVPFAGPDVADNRTWIDSFALEELGKVVLIDGHYYRTGPASSPEITIETILAPDANLPGYLQTFEAANQVFRISECNSVYDGGKTGVSDVFGSALWALDFCWTVAEAGGQGINFHGGTGGAYSPVVRTGNVWTARPEYYAMLAFKAGSGGRTIPVDVTAGNLNASAYACLSGSSEYLTLIDKDVQPIAFTIIPGNPAQSVQVMRLSAPSLGSPADSVTWANHQVSPDGRFTPGFPELYGGTGSIIVNVSAGSAALVIIRE